KQGLLDAVMEVGFDYQVGIAGTRLTGAQRQKLAISRAVLKRPDILIVDDATAALDAGSQERIRKNLLENTNGRTLIWVGPHAKVASEFDTILVLEGGRVAEQGTFEELNQPGTMLHEMLVAD
ncbi:MAG: putative ABC transport system ATP-binding protein, partial [Gammaproteobacteria bacterium]